MPSNKFSVNIFYKALVFYDKTICPAHTEQLKYKKVLSLTKKEKEMKALVSIIMGSTSDWPVMQKAADFLNEHGIAFEMHALSAHRTPEEAGEFARKAQSRGIKVIIAAAGMAAHLPGVMASFSNLPVIGVPINSSLEGLDALLSISQMPPGIPVATVGINASQNAAILAMQILATGNKTIAQKVAKHKKQLKSKIIKANKELKKVVYPYKTN